MDIIPYPVKIAKLSNSHKDKDVVKKARKLYSTTFRKTKRRPYIRSAYFHKQKIFFSHFWRHLDQKGPRQRKIRIVFLPCAIELIKKSRNSPVSMINTNRKTEILHRFAGVTKGKELFYVQIKENLRTNRKEFMSVFPAKD